MTDPTPHISFERIVDFYEKRLPDGESGAVARHLAGCTACAARLSELGHVLELMVTDDSEAPPGRAVEAARRAFRDRPAAAVPSFVRRVVAMLTFESTGASPAYGFRSAQPSERNLLFTAEEYDVQVTARPMDGSWSIAGQVLGPEVAGEIALVGERDEMVVPLSDLCEFTLPPVGAGRYTLALRLDDVEIVLPELLLE